MSIESRSHQYGKVFDHWQIRELLGTGSGGKSAVFRMVHTSSAGVECALKVISLLEERGRFEDLSAFRKEEYQKVRDEFTVSAEQEVLMMHNLQGNTNVVDYLDHTFVDWQTDTGFGRDMLIRMEKLSDLRREISRGRIFSPQEVLKVGRDICTALILCHSRGIVHRDIKPENIFVNKHGSYKLGDFGISRIIDNSSMKASTGVGTPQYWAPEQISGSYDQRVDIYSLGLVLYELCNRNRLPFAASSYVRDIEIQKRMLGTPMPQPVDAETAMGQIILKACAYRPEDRYQSAEQFLQALAPGYTPSSQLYSTIPVQGVTKNPFSTIPEENAQKDLYGTAPALASQENLYNTEPAFGSSQLDTQAAAPDSVTAPVSASPWKRKFLFLPFFVAALGLLLLINPFRDQNRGNPETTPADTQSAAPPVSTVPPSFTASVTDAFCDVAIHPEFGEKYCYHIPEFQTSGPSVNAINQEIYDNFYGILQESVYGDSVYLSSMNYTWGRKDHLASVVVQTVYSHNYVWTDYHIYNISAETGKKISDQELLSAFGLTQAQFHSQVKARLQEYWDSQTDLLEMTGEAVFNQLVTDTLSDENIRQTIPFINSRGELGFVAYIASPAGSSGYYHLVSFTGDILEYITACSQDHSADFAALATPIYINEMSWYSKHGKLWLHEDKEYSTGNNLYYDYNATGHLSRPVADSQGNVYRYGMHVDGEGVGPFSITYALNGQYSHFSGTCIAPYNMAGTSGSKYFEIYCDGKLVYTTATMRSGSAPDDFYLDVTGVNLLTIQYPPTKGSNEMAVLCDGLLW